MPDTDNHITRMQPISRSLHRSLGLDTAVLCGVALLIATAANALSPVGLSWLKLSVSENAIPAAARIEALGYENASLETTRQIVAAGEYLIFDARSAAAFIEGHLPGAMSWPRRDAQQQLGAYLPLLAADQPILVYCSGAACDDSLQLAGVIREQGVERIAIFTGGYAAWTDAGLEIEEGE